MADLVRRDEEHYGAPQDVEWAIEDGQTYLRQSRPVTTLPGHSAGDGQVQDAPVELARGLGASPGRACGPVRFGNLAAGSRQAPGPARSWSPQ